MKLPLAIAIVLAFAGGAHAQDAEPTCAAGEWTQHEQVDPITDVYSCTVVRASGEYGEPGHLFFAATRGGNGFVLLRGNDISVKASQSIRVDRMKPHTFKTQLDGAAAAQLIAELKKGETVRTQYTQWPSGGLVNTEEAICDLPAKIDDCIAKYKARRK